MTIFVSCLPQVDIPNCAMLYLAEHVYAVSSVCGPLSMYRGRVFKTTMRAREKDRKWESVVYMYLQMFAKVLKFFINTSLECMSSL